MARQSAGYPARASFLYVNKVARVCRPCRAYCSFLHLGFFRLFIRPRRNRRTARGLKWVWKLIVGTHPHPCRFSHFSPALDLTNSKTTTPRCAATGDRHSKLDSPTASKPGEAEASPLSPRRSPGPSQHQNNRRCPSRQLPQPERNQATTIRVPPPAATGIAEDAPACEHRDEDGHTAGYRYEGGDSRSKPRQDDLEAHKSQLRQASGGLARFRRSHAKYRRTWSSNRTND